MSKEEWFDVNNFTPSYYEPVNLKLGDRVLPGLYQLLPYKDPDDDELDEPEDDNEYWHCLDDDDPHVLTAGEHDELWCYAPDELDAEMNGICEETL